MAGPQSVSPKSVVPSRPRRRFTLAEANKSLPLVSRVVRDIVNTHQNVQNLHSQFEAAVPGKEQNRIQQDLEREVDHLNDYVDELAEIGAELKDYQLGLIDFVGRHQGRDVYLCWKLGEEQIGHWHELSEGFAGRQPVSMLQETD